VSVPPIFPLRGFGLVGIAIFVFAGFRFVERLFLFGVICLGVLWAGDQVGDGRSSAFERRWLGACIK
jgi:hypothetical protein